MGVRAVQLLEAGIPEPHMIGLSSNTIAAVPLAKILKTIREAKFQEELSPNTIHAFQLSQRLEQPPHKKTGGVRIGVLTDGNNVSGMNMAIRAIARLAINQGIEVVGIKGGFAGLQQGSENVLYLAWSMLEMKGVLRRAGTLLGVSSNGFPTDGKDFLILRKQVEQLNLHGLIAIGDSKTYQYAHNLSDIIHIPVVGIPAALCCNLLGTDWVIGMDSALNDLLKGIDRAADAANVQKKIFVVHIKGEYCVCLVNLAGLAGGVELLVVDEGLEQEEFKELVKEKINELQRVLSLGKSFATIVFFSEKSEQGNDRLQYTIQSIKQEGIVLDIAVISLETSLGGIIPTAFDRILAQRLGEKALSTLQHTMEEHDHTFHTVGIQGKEISATSTADARGGFSRPCSETLKHEIGDCIDLMSLPSETCAGLGGDIDWIDTSDPAQWHGIWTCKQCGTTQSFSFNPRTMLCVYCTTETCNNYGYIRISRRL
jgi:6-phosphofructokinase 1